MKRTAFTHFHEALGARMEAFAGYLMPISYEGINEEHNTVRNAVGVFDVSHMGEFWVKGPKATEFVQFVTTNDVKALFDGKVQYSCFPNGKGGIVDDLLVYRVNEETYLLVVNASNIEKDWNWCAMHAEKMGLVVGKDLYNASDEICQLAVQGPKAMEVMQKLVPVTITDMEYYTFRKVEVAGIKDAILSTTGYTGSGGCEIYIANKDADQLWEAIFDAGKEYGIKAIGLGARDTLRLESGFCLYGNDIDDTTSPIEAGLGWITKFNDQNNFIDKDFLIKQKEAKPAKMLKGFEMIEKGIARHGYPVEDANGNEIGVVTSGTVSPLTKKSIGMAYIKAGHHQLGTEIYIRIRNKSLKAVVAKTPFF